MPKVLKPVLAVVVPIEKIVERYYRSIQQCVNVVPFVDRLDLFDNTESGDEAWNRLFKLGPDRQFTAYVTEAELPDWARPVLEAARDVASH